MKIECKWCDELSKNNFKHELYTVCTTPLPIVYFMTLRKDIDQMESIQTVKDSKKHKNKY